MIKNGRFLIGAARLLFGVKTYTKTHVFFAVKTGPRFFRFLLVFPSAPQNAAYDAKLFGKISTNIQFDRRVCWVFTFENYFSGQIINSFYIDTLFKANSKHFPWHNARFALI